MCCGGLFNEKLRQMKILEAANEFARGTYHTYFVSVRSQLLVQVESGLRAWRAPVFLISDMSTVISLNS